MKSSAKTPLAHVGSIIEKSLGSYRRQNDMEMLQIFDMWEEAVGETVSINAKPAAFKGNLLLVHVSSSAWMHHLFFQKHDLIKKINATLGSDLVRELKFKIGCI